MKQRVAYLALVFGLVGAVSFGCSDDDTVTPGHGGAAGTAGKAGSGGKGGSSGNGGLIIEAGSAGETSSAGSAGTEQGAAAGAGGEGGGVAGAGGEGGEGGYTTAQIERGTLIVRSLALCGSCHSVAAKGTTPAGPELGGNPAFANNLGAPNLTNDPSGIADFSDEQVINSIRNGIALRKENDQERHLSSVMPYWLFHNMTDDDAQAVVAFLRTGVTPVAATVVTGKMDAAVVAPLDPSALPASSIMTGDADFEAAERGKYLVSGVAQCVKCHSTSSGGLPVAPFFAGVPPMTATAIFAPNITPDNSIPPTGIFGWDATDVATALKAGTNKAGRTLCGNMPSAAKGYGGMTDADAHAIGVYLTHIPGVNKPTTDPGLQPACPPPTP